MSTLEENVQRGAAWLDSVRPGWEQDIDPANLNLRFTDRCVLGQIGKAVAEENGITLSRSGYNVILADSTAIYHEACLADLRTAVEGEPLEWASRHGFNSWGSLLDDAYRVLDDLWIGEIKDRVNR